MCVVCSYTIFQILRDYIEKTLHQLSDRKKDNVAGDGILRVVVSLALLYILVKNKMTLQAYVAQLCDLMLVQASEVDGTVLTQYREILDTHFPDLHK